MLEEEAKGIECCGRKHGESNLWEDTENPMMWEEAKRIQCCGREAWGIQCCGRKQRESNAVEGKHGKSNVVGGSMGNPMLWEES
jgi:hypothetical protein